MRKSQSLLYGKVIIMHAIIPKPIDKIYSKLDKYFHPIQTAKTFNKINVEHTFQI